MSDVLNKQISFKKYFNIRLLAILITAALFISDSSLINYSSREQRYISVLFYAVFVVVFAESILIAYKKRRTRNVNIR